MWVAAITALGGLLFGYDTGVIPRGVAVHRQGLARVVIRLAVGSASMVVPLHIGEAAPARWSFQQITGINTITYYAPTPVPNAIGVTPDVVLEGTGQGPLVLALADVVDLTA